MHQTVVSRPRVDLEDGTTSNWVVARSALGNIASKNIKAATPATRSSSEVSDLCLSECDAPSASINRWFLLGVLSIYTVFIGSHLFNWMAWEDCLLQQGAFRSLCPENLLPGKTCSEQNNAISAMVPVITLSYFSFSFIAGLLHDLVSPKACSLVGIALLTSGWLILGLASESRLLLYTIGYAFLGCGSDPAFFGTFGVANLFPGHVSIIISVLAAARAISMFFPVAMHQLQMVSPYVLSLSHQCFVFAVISVCAWFFALYFIPSVTQDKSEEQFEDSHYDSQDAALLKGTIVPLWVTATDPTESTASYNSSRQSSLQMGEQSSLVPQTSADNLGNSDNFSVNAAVCNCNSNGYEAGSAVLRSQLPQQHTAGATATSTTRCNAVIDSNGESAVALNIKSGAVYNRHCSVLQQLYYVASACHSKLYGLLLCVAVLTITRNSFLLISASAQLGSTGWIFGWATTLALLPCPFIGVLIHWAGSIVIIQLLNVATSLGFAALLCAQAATALSSWYTPLCLISILLIWSGVAFNLTQFYCYIAEVFPRRHMGKLIGFASAVGGLFSLVATPLEKYSRDYADFFSGDAVVLAFSVINTLIISYLTWRIRRITLPLK